MNAARFLSACWIDDRSEPGILWADTSQHAVRLFCLPFLVAGCFVVGCAAYGLCIGVPWLRLAMPLTIGILFCLVPGCVALSSSGFVVDGHTRTLTTWFSFFGFRTEEHYRFDELQCLVVVRFWNRGRRGHRKLYKITVERRLTGTRPIELADNVASAWHCRRIIRCLPKSMEPPASFQDETRPSRQAIDNSA
jgi:hypothetical protein